MTAIAERTEDIVTKQRDTFAERMLGSVCSVFDIFTIFIGDQIGYYRDLAENGPSTYPEVADRTGANERYTREWLEQQAVGGILEVQNADAAPENRRFSLPVGHREVLVERDSLNYLAPLAQLAVGGVRPIESVLDAFRRGGGVPFGDYGRHLREGQAGMNRAMFLQQLGREWLPAVPDVDARLKADPPARIADFGCGYGWSSIGMARSYPIVAVDGFDLDAPSIERACKNAREAGVADRVQFQVRDIGDADLAGRYDLVTAFECVHDLSNPVEALQSMRRLAGETGTVIVMDERASETFTPAGNEIESFLYGCSVLHCLPVGMADSPSAGTGTVMRPEILRKYAREAGFVDVEVLPIDNFFFRFYRLQQ